MMDGLLDQAILGLEENDGGMLGFGAVSRALEYIHTADPGQLSVRQISRHAGMSESRLRQLFREYTGRPVGEFVANLRLDRAYQLIAENGATVSDASLQVGYSNIGYFSRRFRTRFGMLPSSLKRAVDVSVIARRFDGRHSTSLAV
jgi:AraC-like DNA-binding protein